MVASVGSLVSASKYVGDSAKPQADSAIAAIRAHAVEVWLLAQSILAFDSEIESDAECGLEPSVTSDSKPLLALALQALSAALAVPTIPAAVAVKALDAVDAVPALVAAVALAGNRAVIRMQQFAAAESYTQSTNSSTAPETGTAVPDASNSSKSIATSDSVLTRTELAQSCT